MTRCQEFKTSHIMTVVRRNPNLNDMVPHVVAKVQKVESVSEAHVCASDAMVLLFM